ncbi:Plasmodium vivax Vir protein, putative [Plasmodium vivax]|uniref:Vir protein, putative n=1 Tax=Plasmodium vivax TaxID=5855 RepID=A0A1G4EAT5_PLAVI|nr:Plasmodium vivax Vir protein, putative [Plasmodium vivax]
MSNDEKYILENISKEHSFIHNLDFYKIYKEFNEPCDNRQVKDACYGGDTEQWSQKNEVKELLKNIHSNLYKIYSTLKRERTEYFDNVVLKDENICCVSLKYWLYDKIVTNDLNDDEIKELFDGWKKHIDPNAIYHQFQPCTFYNLNMDEIKSIKNIYALYTILQSTTKSFENCNEIECKYKDYFEQGLVEFINSVNKCSNNPSENEYCKEFKDFLQICTGSNTYAGIAVYNEYKGSIDNTSKKYLLFAEKYENDKLYAYIKDNIWLNWSKIDHIVNPQKRTTIAATSVVGSAIGLSSIFYYLYKYTPFGSSLRKGKGKNIVNIDEGTRDFLLYTSEAEQEPFKSMKYNVAYHTFRDT